METMASIRREVETRQVKAEETVEAHSTESMGRKTSPPPGSVCFICYDHDEPEKRLLSPCKCSGSMGYGTFNAAFSLHNHDTQRLFQGTDIGKHSSAQRMPARVDQGETVVGTRVLHLPHALQGQPPTHDD